MTQKDPGDRVLLFYTKAGAKMSEVVIVAIITGGLSLIGTLAGSYFSNRKSVAVITWRIDQLEKKVEKPGYVLARFFEHVVPFEETIDGLTVRGYEYDEYHLELPNSADLFDYILERYNYYMAEAKRCEPSAIDELTLTQLAVAELAEVQEANNLALQLAIAELAEALLGGGA